MEKPLISILITCYNGLPYIKNTIESLLCQTYPNLEIIVIDDHSTDGTQDFLFKLAKGNPSIFYFINPEKGRSKALNFGLGKCLGKYVAINDADDFSLPERIEKQVAFLENNSEYGIVGSMSKLVSMESGAILGISDKRPVNDEDIRYFLTKGQPIQHVTVMFNKKLVLALGGYNEKIKFMVDRDLFIRIARVSKMHNLDEILVLVGEHKNRFFKYNYKGLERNWMSTKYQIRAITTLGYSPLRIVPVISKFLYSSLLIFKDYMFGYGKN